MAGNYEVFEHTADVGLYAYGNTLKDLFIHAAQGMESLMVVPEQVHIRVSREISVQAHDSVSEIRAVMERGSAWAIEEGYGFSEDLEVTEERGCLAGAIPSTVSDTALRRGIKQLGSLGSGNHFCEVQKVDHIYDTEAAAALGIGQPGQIVQPVLIPGDMGRYSFVLVGAPGSMEQSFGSCCHGAGRRQSRTAAKKSLSSKDLLNQLDARGVTIRVHSKNLLTEEAPQAYKDARTPVPTKSGE